MKRAPLQIVLVTLLAIGLVGCGREQAASAASVQATDEKAKDDPKKASPPDNAPKVVDPLKEGY